MGHASRHRQRHWRVCGGQSRRSALARSSRRAHQPGSLRGGVSLSWRARAEIAGVPARLLRVGFVGELGYEIHVPADRACVLWDALMEAGRVHGIRPFGVEAQRLLRLEKGHIIIGQDTDGLTTPAEAGVDWAVKMDKPYFVGQRSLKIVERKNPKAEERFGRVHAGSDNSKRDTQGVSSGHPRRENCGPGYQHRLESRIGEIRWPGIRVAGDHCKRGQLLHSRGRWGDGELTDREYALLRLRRRATEIRRMTMNTTRTDPFARPVR